jgi:hypothetical protein
MPLVLPWSMYLFCNRCKDFDVDACNDHASTIFKLNDDIAKLHAQLKICKDECDKINFVRDAYTIGRHPCIKDGLGFQKGTKDAKSQKAPNSLRRRGKHLWLVAHILFMIIRTMLSFILMLRMLMLIMILIMIILFYLCVMMLFLLLALRLLHPAIHMLIVRVDPGAMHLMLSLMRLMIGMHLMVLLCYFVLLVHPMCFIIRIIELLHLMWDPKARRVRLAFGYQNPM